MSGEPHNYVLASGIVSKNSHAVSYSMVSTVEMWLKHHWPVAYLTAVLNNVKSGKKVFGQLGTTLYTNYARRRRIEVLGPDINKSSGDFLIEERGDGSKAIRFSLQQIKGILDIADSLVMARGDRPFENMADFYSRSICGRPVKTGPNKGKIVESRPNKAVLEALIFTGAFDQFGDRNQMLAEYAVASIGVPQPSDDELVTLEAYHRKGREDLWPHINDASSGCELVKGAEKVSPKIAEVVEETGPFESMVDFYERCKYEIEIQSGKNKGTMRKSRPNKVSVEALIYAGAFDCFGDRRQMLLDYHMAREKMTENKLPNDKLKKLEIGLIGLCLSQDPLRNKCAELVRMREREIAEAMESGNGEVAAGLERLYTIDHRMRRKKATVVGRIDKIEPKVSKAGNHMFMVTMSDDVDSMQFFVFKDGRPRFSSKAQEGLVMAVPLDRFPDGGMSFYDDSKVCVKLSVGA